MTDDEAFDAIDRLLFRADGEEDHGAFALLPPDEQAEHDRAMDADLARWRKERDAARKVQVVASGEHVPLGAEQ